MLELMRGNLLEAETDALVNTVNTVGVMGKGIALQFKMAFPDNFAAYKSACDVHQVQPGRMFIHERKTLTQPRYIINFPTKRHWKGVSRMEDIESGLENLVQQVRELNIGSIAIPPLGCGLGGLNWDEVKARIEAAFQNLPKVRVLLFEPAGAPSPSKIIHHAPPPRMTKGRAAIIGLIHQYVVMTYDFVLSMLEIQKLAYFLVEAGEDLRLEFAKNQYGPYADNLRKSLRDMEGHFTEGFGDGNNKPDTPMKLLPGAVDAANHFLADHPETKEKFSRVAMLIEGFETPYGMELLSTIHWIARHENPAALTDDAAAIEGVHRWNDRKCRIFRPDHIRIAWTRLKDQGWLK
ncbi:MAG: macro domain-containing protein [Magnetococcales bacterium]|nr:macro domain-containing protein [Magnetococcales bacterium]